MQLQGVGRWNGWCKREAGGFLLMTCRVRVAESQQGQRKRERQIAVERDVDTMGVMRFVVILCAGEFGLIINVEGYGRNSMGMMIVIVAKFRFRHRIMVVQVPMQMLVLISVAVGMLLIRDIRSLADSVQQGMIQYKQQRQEDFSGHARTHLVERRLA